MVKLDKVKANNKDKCPISIIIKNSIITSYEGILPDLFAENQGVIASGKYINGVFVAEEILAKHDESYLPKEVIEILKKDGTYIEPDK